MVPARGPIPIPSNGKGLMQIPQRIANNQLYIMYPPILLSNCAKFTNAKEQHFCCFLQDIEITVILISLTYCTAFVYTNCAEFHVILWKKIAFKHQ